MVNYLKKQILITSCSKSIHSNTQFAAIQNAANSTSGSKKATLVYLGQALVGYSLGWSAPVIPKLTDPEQTPLPEAISDEEAAWAGTLLYVGTIVGPYVTGYLGNVKGRKPCLFLGGAINLVAFIVLALANSVIMIYAGRILIGAGAAIIAIMNLVYIGEIASTNIRGILLTMTGIFSTFGTLIVYSVGPYVPYQWVSWLGAGLTVLYIAGICTIPETPVFQAIVGQEEEAKEILLSLGRPEDIDKIATTKENLADSKKDWMQIFTIKTNRRALFITLSLNVLQQMSGVVAVVFFATSIFEFAGSSIEPNIATIIIGVTQIFASTITPFFVERAGRKSLLMFSTMASCLSLAVLGIYFQLDNVDHPGVEKIKWLPLVSLISFFLSYDLGFGIIPNTLMGEMFTSNVRSPGTVLVSTVSYLVGFGVSTAFGYMLPALGGAITFWVFSTSCAVAFLFSVFFVPETKGKSLAEIREMLSK